MTHLFTLAQLDPDPSQRYVVGGAVALAAMAVLCFASISTYKWLFWPELTDAWPLRKRLLLALVSFAAGALAIVARVMDHVQSRDVERLPGYIEREFGPHFLEFFRTIAELLGVGLLVVLSIALAVKLYEKWVNGRLAEAERAGGAASVRAWFAPMNLIVAIGIALCAAVGLGYSFWLVLLLSVGALAAHPLLAALAEPAAAPAAPPDVISPERDRVMRLLEQGKITAEESAELLGALAATVPPPPPPLMTEPWTLSRRLMLAGAAVVILGFFMPWYSINPAREVRRMSDAMNKQMRQLVESDMPVAPMPIPKTDQLAINVADGQTFRIAGGDIPSGLGWLVLFLAAGAAALPYVATGMRRDTRSKAMLAMLAVGLLIVVYLTTTRPSHVSFGLPVVLLGYVLELLAVWRERERRGEAGQLPQAAPAL